MNTCTCKYHMEMVELILRFSNMCNGGTKGVHGTQCICACDICSINIVLGEYIVDRCQFSGVINMWNSILCPVDDSPWHNPSCLKGTCAQCGNDILLTYFVEEDATCSQLMQWECYELVLHGMTRFGKDNKVLWLQYKKTRLIKFLQYLRPKL